MAGPSWGEPAVLAAVVRAPDPLDPLIRGVLRALAPHPRRHLAGSTLASRTTPAALSVVRLSSSGTRARSPATSRGSEIAGVESALAVSSRPRACPSVAPSISTASTLLCDCSSVACPAPSDRPGICVGGRGTSTPSPALGRAVTTASPGGHCEAGGATPPGAALASLEAPSPLAIARSAPSPNAPPLPPPSTLM